MSFKFKIEDTKEQFMTKFEKEQCKQMLNTVYLKMMMSGEFDTDTIMKLLNVIQIIDQCK